VLNVLHTFFYRLSCISKQKITLNLLSLISHSRPNKELSKKARNIKFTPRNAVAISVLLALTHTSVAQETDPNIEVIQVTSVRGALENALSVKRSASSIVDHLSAEDIGQLPALDLGDALQTIPGVQLNADGGDRASTINLRGLPFASTGLSTTAQGVSNPFGAFEAAIFRGATVIKAPTADLPAGGIGGYIDKKLPRALWIQDETTCS
jgi:hypothetical protein